MNTNCKKSRETHVSSFVLRKNEEKTFQLFLEKLVSFRVVILEQFENFNFLILDFMILSNFLIIGNLILLGRQVLIFDEKRQNYSRLPSSTIIFKLNYAHL
jgi:hypothetical protein